MSLTTKTTSTAKKPRRTAVEDRAEQLHDLIDRYFIADNGFLRYNINRQTLRPFTEKELEGCEVVWDGTDTADRWTYEDTVYTSGIYFWALAEAYKVSGDERHRQRADRLFDGLVPLFQACSEIEPGYIGKPWGAKPSRNTTLDQTFYLTTGLHEYHTIANDDRKPKIDQVITSNADWWIRRDYYNFDHPTDVQAIWTKPSHSGPMMTQMYLAYLHGRDERYLTACQDLIERFDADVFLPRQSPQWEPVDERGLKARRSALWHQSMAWALHILARHWPDRLAHWQERFVEQWNKEMKLGLRDDGLTYITVRVALADEREVPFGLDEAGPRTPTPGSYIAPNSAHWRWVCAGVSGYFSAHTAVSAALMADVVPWMRGPASKTVHTVLEQVGPDELVWAMDPDGRQLPPKRGHWPRSLTSKGITAWLLAYWISRRIGLLDTPA